MRRLLFALAFLASSFTAVPLANADERDDAVNARAMEILPWIAEVTGYSADYVKPGILFRDQDTLNKLYYGANYRDGYADVEAAAMGNVIILRDDFVLGEDDATLAHELTHVLQNENGAEFDCHAKMEYEAYQTGDLFVDTFGIGEKTDPLWLIFFTMCPANHYGLP